MCIFTSDWLAMFVYQCLLGEFYALQGFFNSLRTELTDFPNILISTVLPGPVQSQIVQNAFTEEVDKVINSYGTKASFDMCPNVNNAALFPIPIVSLTTSACDLSW